MTTQGIFLFNAEPRGGDKNMKVTNADRIAWLVLRKPLWSSLYSSSSNRLVQIAVLEDVFGSSGRGRTL